MSARPALDELCARKRAQVIRLQEVADVTRRMAEAADRRDEVAVRMLLGEREQPLLSLHETEEEIRTFLNTLPEEEAIRAGELLRGAEAETEQERPLAEQVLRFRRTLDDVIERDRSLSLRLGGNRSFYKTYRE